VQNHPSEILSFRNTPLSRAADSAMPFICFLVLPYPMPDTTFLFITLRSGLKMSEYEVYWLTDFPLLSMRQEICNYGDLSKKANKQV